MTQYNCKNKVEFQLFHSSVLQVKTSLKFKAFKDKNKSFHPSHWQKFKSINNRKEMTSSLTSFLKILLILLHKTMCISFPPTLQVSDMCQPQSTRALCSGPDLEGRSYTTQVHQAVKHHREA